MPTPTLSAPGMSGLLLPRSTGSLSAGQGGNLWFSPIRLPNEEVGIGGSDVSIDIDANPDWVEVEFWDSEPKNGRLERTGKRPRRTLRIPRFGDAVPFGSGLHLFVFNGPLPGIRGIAESPFVNAAGTKIPVPYFGDFKFFVVLGCERLITRQLVKVTIQTFKLPENSAATELQLVPPGGGFKADAKPGNQSAPYEKSGGGTVDGEGYSYLYDVPGAGIQQLAAYRDLAVQLNVKLRVHHDFTFQTWFECQGKAPSCYEWGFMLDITFDQNGELFDLQGHLIGDSEPVKVKPGIPILPGNPRYEGDLAAYQALTK